MAFFDDMKAALETYPKTDLTLEIIDVATPGEVLNVTETATFTVKVANTGPLNLISFTLRIKGMNGATVANNGAAAPFVSEFVTQELPTITGHGGSQLTVGSPLKFQGTGRRASLEEPREGDLRRRSRRLVNPQPKEATP